MVSILPGDPHTLRVQRKHWQAYVRSACNKLAAGHDVWQAKVSEGRRALVGLIDVRASIQWALSYEQSIFHFLLLSLVRLTKLSSLRRSLDTLHLGFLATVPGLLAASTQKLALQEQNSLSRLQAALAGLQLAGADLQACWINVNSVDGCPVFASMSLSSIGRLFQRVGQACAAGVLARESVVMVLIPDCLDEPIVLSLVPEAKPSQRLLEGALLAWSTDLAVSDAVEALQGALSEEMRRF